MINKKKKNIILFGSLDGRKVFLSNFKKKNLIYEETTGKKNITKKEMDNSFYECFLFTKNFHEIKENISINYIISCNSLYEIPILLRLNTELHYFREDFIYNNISMMELKHRRFQRI